MDGSPTKSRSRISVELGACPVLNQGLFQLPKLSSLMLVSSMSTVKTTVLPGPASYS